MKACIAGDHTSVMLFSCLYQHSSAKSRAALTSSTLWAVFAEVSKNTRLCSRANCSPSSVLTARLCCSTKLVSWPLLCAHCRGRHKQVAEPHREIALVANEHDGHVGVRMLPGIFKPAGKVIEGLSPAIAVGSEYSHLSKPSQMQASSGIPTCRCHTPTERLLRLCSMTG